MPDGLLEIRRLLERARGKGRLPAAKNREPIPAARSTAASPGSAAAGQLGALVSPLTELRRTEVFTDISGVLVADCTSVEFEDGVGRRMVMVLNPPSDAES